MGGVSTSRERWNSGAGLGDALVSTTDFMTTKKASKLNARVRSPAVTGSGALTWSEEPPRAGGLWWWWEGREELAPTIVKLTADHVTLWLYKAPTMQWHGLTRVRVVTEVGGWWCGPVEYTEPPLVEPRPNVRADRPEDEP